MTDSDVARYSLVLGSAQQDVLAKIAKKYKISQRVVLETMLDNLNEEVIGPLLAQKRSEIVQAREDKKAIMKKLKKLTPEQMALVQQLSENNGQ
jgi:uncharacterized protein (DUF111 family)